MWKRKRRRVVRRLAGVDVMSNLGKRCWWLELKAQSELHDSWVVGAVQDKKAATRARWVAGVESGAAISGWQARASGVFGAIQCIQLGVIEDVEILPAE